MAVVVGPRRGCAARRLVFLRVFAALLFAFGANLCGTDPRARVGEEDSQPRESAARGRGCVAYETGRGMCDFPWPRAVGRQRRAAIRD